jgi:hypothetical protein
VVTPSGASIRPTSADNYVKRQCAAREGRPRARFAFDDLRIRSALSKKSQFDRNYFLLVRELAPTAPAYQHKPALGELLLMTRMIFAAALALAAFGFAPAFTSVANAYDSVATKPRIDISRIKSVLRLTPDQQAYWPAVEAALRGLAHRQVQEQQGDQTEGLVKRVSNRVYAYALDAASLARIGAAVRPLVKVLDERQKKDAVALCHEMGLGQVLAALI